MSLETQIANLVAATNQLTGEVSGKMTQIDQRVEQKRNELEAWRTGYRAEDAVGIQVFVSSTGNDANDGSSPGSAVATIARAVSLLPRVGNISVQSDLVLAGVGADCGGRDVSVLLNGHAIHFVSVNINDPAGIYVGTGFYRIENWRRLQFSGGNVQIDSVAPSAQGDQFFYRTRRSPLVAGGFARFASLGFAGCNISIGDNAVGAVGSWHATETYGLVSGYAVVSRTDTNTTLGVGAEFAQSFDVERGFAHDGTL